MEYGARQSEFKRRGTMTRFRVARPVDPSNAFDFPTRHIRIYIFLVARHVAAIKRELYRRRGRNVSRSRKYLTSIDTREIESVYVLESYLSPKSSLSMRKCTHPFPFFIDVAEPEVIHFQDVELLAHIFEDVPPFLLWLQRKKN